MLLLLPLFFFPVSTVLFGKCHWIVFWVIIQEIRWDYFVYNFYFSFFSFGTNNCYYFEINSVDHCSFITSYQALRLNSIGLWINLLEIACNLSVKILNYKIFVTLGLWKCTSRILWLLCLLYLSCDVWIDALGNKENLKFSIC